MICFVRTFFPPSRKFRIYPLVPDHSVTDLTYQRRRLAGMALMPDRSFRTVHGMEHLKWVTPRSHCWVRADELHLLEDDIAGSTEETQLRADIYDLKEYLGWRICEEGLVESERVRAQEAIEESKVLRSERTRLGLLVKKLQHRVETLKKEIAKSKMSP